MSVASDILSKYIPNPAVADTDAICTEQDLIEGGALDLDGATVSNDVAVLDPARQAAIVCTIPGMDPTSVFFTITGTNEFGVSQVVTVEYTPVTAQVVTTQYWSTITSISCTGAIDDVTVGTDDSFATVISPSRARLKGLNYVQDGTTTKTLEVKDGTTVRYSCDMVGKSAIADSADNAAVVYIPQNGILFKSNMAIYGEVGDFFSVNVLYQR